MRGPLSPIAALLAVTLAGCAGSLADQLREQPDGRFAPASLSALAEPAAPTPGETPAPAVPAAPASADGGPVDRPSSDGPVTSEELAAAGVAVDAAALARAQESSWRPASTLDRETALLAFLGRSQAVRAAVRRYRASFARYGQVEWLNDIASQYDSFARDLSPTVGPMRMGAAPAWPLGGVGRLQSAIVGADVARARARLAMDVLSALVIFEEAFQEAIYRERATEVLARDGRVAAQVVAAAEALYSGGRVGYADVLTARMRLDDLSERRQTSAEQAAAQRLALAASLDLGPAVLDGVALQGGAPVPTLPDRDAARAAAGQGPEVRLAEAAAERASLMVQLVERQLLPEVSPGTAFGRDGAVPRRGGDLMYATGAPFLAELRLMRDAQQAALEQARRAAPATADGRWVALSDALRMSRLLRGPQRSRARQALEAATDSYRAGRATFVEVSQSLTQLLDVELAAERQRRDAFVQAARLRAVLGADLR